MKTMWSFKTKNFTITWEIEPDDLNVMYMDKELAQECRKKVRSGKWKCFSSTVTVRDNAMGIELGEATLGNSIYAKPADFRDHFGMNQKGHGSYFSDMVREAISEARKNFPTHQQRIQQEIQKRQRVLFVRLRNTESQAIKA